MAQTITIARAYCDDHMGDCYQAYNDQTGRTECIDYLSYTKALKESGYVYTGHRAGQYTYTLRKSAPLDWQMAIEERETVDEYQDW